MPISATDIVNKALTLIDEQLLELSQIGTAEMSTKDTALDILPEVCRDLIKELPFGLKIYLEKTGTVSASLADGQEGYVKKKVRISAPDDFWELVSLKMNVWSQAATKYIYIDYPDYTYQNNPFTRGGKQNPVVALANGITNKTIECFSVGEGDSLSVDYLKYISFDNVPDDEAEGVRWPDELMDEVSKALASQLLVIKGQTESGLLRGEETQQAIEQHG